MPTSVENKYESKIIEYVTLMNNILLAIWWQDHHLKLPSEVSVNMTTLMQLPLDTVESLLCMFLDTLRRGVTPFKNIRTKYIGCVYATCNMQH